jgi:DNA-binding NarL/FixJ family response regulator
VDALRVLLVEDDEVVHRALGSLIDLLPGCALVGIALTVGQALEEVARLRPDVLLMNAELPGALAAIGALRAAAVPPDGASVTPLRVVLVSVYGRGERLARAGGADAYILADCGPWVLCAALHGERPPDTSGGGQPAGPCCVAAADPAVAGVLCGALPRRRPPWD